MTNCTRCEGTGFLNLDTESFKEMDDDKILQWIHKNPDTDIQVCDCCGDGEGWYGEPGEHYNTQDPPGYNGPYAYNGGLCECH